MKLTVLLLTTVFTASSFAAPIRVRICVFDGEGESQKVACDKAVGNLNAWAKEYYYTHRNDDKSTARLDNIVELIEDVAQDLEDTAATIKEESEQNNRKADHYAHILPYLETQAGELK